ncbi:cyclic nucleotide-binding domain-containing protein [Mycolicibacterium sp. S2-37]|uniref:putative nucleotidyltransferase substrate binding domain-containing protein n=1 Tax=Mycolicibacterium sp. S2-37 TaxID=2810297 RepID=UPI001A93E507|nr:putative nucleotidyltransferase substrate binding domain-containing protein [Mycolicibacterium sp. S2-37]MBO0678279.1 cyclic nucleotide-binding domain-containing protein [Mycolicibacterium sp. S2-37]
MREYIDFLGGQPPYDTLDAADLEAVARLVEVEYFAAGTAIVLAGGAPLSRFYVVRSGEVEVVDRGRVIDVLGVGETFGQISVLSGLAPPLTVRSSRDTLCYLFPDLRSHLRDPDRLQFSHYGSLVSRERLARSGLTDQSIRQARDQMRPVVWCRTQASVAEVAAAMTDAGQSCALVRGRDGRIGIVTDSDFRAGLAGGTVGAHTPIQRLASFPAASVSAETLAGEAFLKMVECGHHHLVVIGERDEPVGILRAVDLASAEVRNPLVIRRAVDDAGTVDDLARASALLPGTWVDLCDTGVSVTHTAALLSAVIDAIASRVVALTDVEGDVDSRETSWMLLGAVARREPLPGSRVSTALVWQDRPDRPPADDTFHRWASRVVATMQRCGLGVGIEQAGATNPVFAGSRARLANEATSCIRTPTRRHAVALSCIITDSRPVTGMALGRSVSDTMFATARSREYLIRLLRHTVSARPPMGFVRDLVVHHTGDHHDRLDLHAVGLLPITSLGRWIAIVTGDGRGNTQARLRRGQSAGLFSDDEADTLTGAFEFIYGLLLATEVSNIRGDRDHQTTYLSPKDLDTLTRRQLREAFRSVAAVQNRLSDDWEARLR